MRILVIAFIACFAGACSPEKKVRAKIESLEQSADDRKYEVGMACMQYILQEGRDISYSKTLVRKLIQLGFFSEAVLAVESLLQESVTDAELLHLRGMAYRNQHQYDLALSDATRAIQLEASNTEFLSELNLTRQEKATWVGIQGLNSALPHSSDSFGILLERAEKFFAMRQYDAALYDLGSVSKMGSPADSSYFAHQVKSIYKDGNPVKMLEAMLAYYRSQRNPG